MTSNLDLNIEGEYNPSVRGKKRNISWIVRCPLKSSKISVRTCKECKFFGGIANNSVLCSFR